MLITDLEDKLYFKCPRCGGRTFEKVETFEFRYNARQKEYLQLKDKDIFRCLNCKHDVYKSQIR